MEALFYRVAVVSAAVSVVLLPLLLTPRWRKRYAPHTRRAVWLVIAAVLLAAPLLPKSQAPVQIQVPERTVTLPAAAPTAPQQGTMPTGPITAVPVPNTAAVQTPPTQTRTVEWGVLLTALWLTGGAAVLLWQGTAYLLARRRLMRDALPLTGYEELAAELCPRRPVRFFRVNGLNTPMTLGVFRPVVLLPQGEVRQAAVCHELIHVRRRDVAWKLLLLLACAVHWFNPLVWVLSRRADRDMEASCDAAVLAGGNASERRAYGELLLETAAGRNIPLTTQFGGGKKRMKERLYDLFHPGKKSRVLVGAVLLLCLLAGSLVACRSAEPMTADEALRALKESVTYEDGTLSFTIPKEYSPVEDWNIHIAGRAEMPSLGGMSLHYLDGEEWEAGKTYTLDITEELWQDVTELTMDVSLGEKNCSMDLLAAVGRYSQGKDTVNIYSQVPDGVYCAPMPGFVKAGEGFDHERWYFTLTEFDPETGARGQVLGKYTLPLAEKLMLLRMGDDNPSDAGEVGSEERDRRVAGFMMWPLLRSSFTPDLTDLLEVRVQDGEVTYLRWFQVPVDDAPAEDTGEVWISQDSTTWPMDDSDFDVFDPTVWPDDGGSALEEVPEWYWWGPYYENKKYGFSLRLPASWRNNYWADGVEDSATFYCGALPEEGGRVARLLIENKPLEQSDGLRLLGEADGCYVYLEMEPYGLPFLLSASVPEEALSLYKTMYTDMKNLPDGALTWWEGY